jgi:hypothetical protein
MWEINLKSQILSFLGSIVLGLIFCVIYDLLRVVRKYGKSNDLRLFIEDIIYFAFRDSWLGESPFPVNPAESAV